MRKGHLSGFPNDIKRFLMSVWKNTKVALSVLLNHVLLLGMDYESNFTCRSLKNLLGLD